MRRLELLGFMVLCFYSIGTCGNQLDLKQITDWKVVIAEDAAPSERYAAEEFRSLLKAAIGIELATATTTASPEHNVFIGPGASATRDKIPELGEEDIYIKITPNCMVITGGRPRGTLYAVYEFMEKYLGVRFLTYDHTYFPTRTTWEIPCEEYTYHPPFSYRWSYYKENEDRHDFAARLRVNTIPVEEKYGGITKQRLISHSLNELLPVKKYGKEHPEYYALVDGERKLVVDYDEPELCVTNPEVINLVAENVIRELDAHPERQNISVSQNDNDAYCRCPQCEEINQREGTPMGSHLAFVNAVAERVEKKYPNVKIGTLSYWYTRKPPKTIVPRKNVQIQLCSIECCTLHAIDDPECQKNREFCQDMENWSKICNEIWVWNYNTDFMYYDLPFPNLKSIGPNIHFFLKNHVKGLFMQANAYGNNGEMCDLRNYVIARCLWNPSLDGWELIQEFCRLHYGSAAETILEYINRMYQITEQAGWHPACFPRPIEVGLTPELSQEIFYRFQKALNLAETPEVRRRVEKASMCTYRAIIETCGQLHFNQDRLWMSWSSPWDLIVDRYVTLVKKYNVTKASEHMSMDTFLIQLHRLRNEGVPAVRLENDYWRLTLVPEQNGTMMEMTYKPTGRNLMYDPRLGGMGRLFSERVFKELGIKGYDSDNPAEFSAELEGTTLTMTKSLPDGSTVVRGIELKQEEPKKIFCRSRITHQGTEPKVYRVMVQPTFGVDTWTCDYRILTGYIKNRDWFVLDENWKEGSNPRQDLLHRSIGGGAIAFYNHLQRFGMLETYDPDQFMNVKFRWIGARPQLGLELISKEVELKKGESFDYSYQLEYLEQPPNTADS